MRNHISQKLTALLLITFVCVFAFTSCSHTQYVRPSGSHADSSYTQHTKTDSVTLRDSIYVKDSVFVCVAGDTVREYRYKQFWRDRIQYRDVETHDTSFIESVDTIYNTIEVEKKLTKFEQRKMQFGGYAIGAMLTIFMFALMYVVFRIRKLV